jgi:hypothetical protein
MLRRHKQTDKRAKQHQQIQGAKEKMEKRIDVQMNDYRQECVSMDMKDYITRNGNDNYKYHVESGKPIAFTKFVNYDAGYVMQFFDVCKWWRDNAEKYKDLAVGANLILGKPTHNAFQERVFSRGTYSDTKLRKKRTEERFEMSVKNSVNYNTIEKVKYVLKSIDNSEEKKQAASEELSAWEKKRLDTYFKARALEESRERNAYTTDEADKETGLDIIDVDETDEEFDNTMTIIDSETEDEDNDLFMGYNKEKSDETSENDEERNVDSQQTVDERQFL